MLSTMKIVDVPQYGPMFRFNDANVYWAMHILSSGKRIGRKKLADEVGIGEGSIRKIIETLRDKGYIDIKQTGITMTGSGESFLKQIPIRPVDVTVDGSVKGDFQQAVIINNVASKINNGMEQRDVGIKVGAEGCTTIVFRNGTLVIPPDWNLDENNPSAAKAIRDCGMGENDVMIIGGGRTMPSAIEASVSAALELI